MSKLPYNETAAINIGNELRGYLENNVIPAIQALSDMGCRADFNINTGDDGVTRLTSYRVQVPLDLIAAKAKQASELPG